jgi:hypothetical protein
MKPLSFRSPALPSFRRAALPALLLSASALAGCSHLTKPPEIALDDMAAPAVLQVDPPHRCGSWNCRRRYRSLVS